MYLIAVKRWREDMQYDIYHSLYHKFTEDDTEKKLLCNVNAMFL